MTGPTPGPWHVDPRAANHVVAESRSVCSISYSDSSRPEETRLENEANARLIAAAPETAAELETVRKIKDELAEALQETNDHVARLLLINAELVEALKGLRPMAAHYANRAIADTGGQLLPKHKEALDAAKAALAKHARAETSDDSDDDEPRDAVREIDGPDGWSDPDEGAR